jgi:hypothetical protein
MLRPRRSELGDLPVVDDGRLCMAVICLSRMPLQLRAELPEQLPE